MLEPGPGCRPASPGGPAHPWGRAQPRVGQQPGLPTVGPNKPPRSTVGAHVSRCLHAALPVGGPGLPRWLWAPQPRPPRAPSPVLPPRTHRRGRLRVPRPSLTGREAPGRPRPCGSRDPVPRAAPEGGCVSVPCGTRFRTPGASAPAAGLPRAGTGPLSSAETGPRGPRSCRQRLRGSPRPHPDGATRVPGL